MTQDIFKSYFLSVVHAAGASFAENMWISGCLGHAKFEKIHFCTYVVISHHIDAVRARLRPSQNEQKPKKNWGLTKCKGLMDISQKGLGADALMRLCQLKIQQKLDLKQMQIAKWNYSKKQHLDKPV